jgi:hypothetical protein
VRCGVSAPLAALLGIFLDGVVIRDGIAVAPRSYVAPQVATIRRLAARALEANMIRFSMWRPMAAAGISICGLVSYACGAPADSSASGDSADTQDLEIHFPAMYSTFDSSHEAKIPAVVTGVSKVKWSLSDPTLADLEVQSDGSAMITIRAAGTVTVIAKAGSLTGKSDLTITAAEDGAWEAGNQRYNNGVVLTRGEHVDGGGGGAPTRRRSRHRARTATATARATARTTSSTRRCRPAATPTTSSSPSSRRA